MEQTLLATLLLSVAIFGIFFLFVGVRVFFLKNGEMRGTCSSQSPFLNKEGITCDLCGKPTTDCPNNNSGLLETSKNVLALPSIKKL